MTKLEKEIKTKEDLHFENAMKPSELKNDIKKMISISYFPEQDKMIFNIINTILFFVSGINCILILLGFHLSLIYLLIVLILVLVNFFSVISNSFISDIITRKRLIKKLNNAYTLSSLTEVLTEMENLILAPFHVRQNIIELNHQLTSFLRLQQATTVTLKQLNNIMIVDYHYVIHENETTYEKSDSITCDILYSNKYAQPYTQPTIQITNWEPLRLIIPL